MKIVRIIARLNVGGPARHVVWLTAGLQSDDWESVLVAGSVPPGEDDMSYFAADNGVTPVYIAQMSREISAGDLISIWKLFRLLVRERPDIVHTHTAKAGTVGRIAALLYRWATLGGLLGKARPCKVVHTYHGHIFHSYYGPINTRFFLMIEKTLARLGTNRIVVVSQQQRREINETFAVGRPEQFVVIPLGLDLTQFASWKDRGKSLRDELGASPEDILVGIVGRLTEIKNHELFFNAIKLFKEMTATPKRVRFIVIGDGGLRQKLKGQVELTGLAGDVVFTGNRNDPENFYPALDLVALTSRNEGTPLTLIEAMANARAVIATSVGGVVDLLGESASETDDNDYLVCTRGVRIKPGDARALAAGLARLVSDSALRQELGERGLRFVQQNYSKERLLNDVRSLYGELIQPQAATLKVVSPERHLESRI